MWLLHSGMPTFTINKGIGTIGMTIFTYYEYGHRGDYNICMIKMGTWMRISDACLFSQRDAHIHHNYGHRDAYICVKMCIRDAHFLGCLFSQLSSMHIVSLRVTTLHCCNLSCYTQLRVASSVSLRVTTLHCPNLSYATQLSSSVSV